jgi:hypothetical protein
MRASRKILWGVLAAATVSILLASCTTINRLDRYEIEGATLATDMRQPPQPRLGIDYQVHIDSKNPIVTALSVGTNILKASEAEKAEASMLRALDSVDVPAIVLSETGRAAARALNADLVERSQRPELLLDLEIREYGIQAPSWGSAVTLHMSIIATLYHTKSRDTIWRRAVTVDDPASPQMFGMHQVVGDVITAGVLSSLTVEQLEEGFRTLAGESARSVSRRLERDFYRVVYR